ncbi:MAG: hypothetical protein R3C53_10975 [Pirellulaceae bacterium]
MQLTAAWKDLHDWTTNQGVKNSTAASLLAFAGGNPLISVGMKQAEIPVLEEIVGYVLERAPDHLRRFIDAAEQDPDDKEKALLALNRGWVLMEEICETMRDKISPALNSHETVFSIAANWKQTQIADLPPSPRPLPLPEMAFACRLADRDLFLEGCNDILIMLDKFVDLVREIEPNSIPENYRVPRPDEEALAGGTRYFYSSLSRQVPLEGFEPQLLVGDNAVIAGYSMRQVDAMLAGEAPDILPSWIQADSPVAVISYANFAGMIEAVRPWAVYGIGLSGIDLDAPVADEEGPGPTPNDLLQIWDTLTELGQSYATATVQPNGTLITRWQWTNAN